MCEVLSSDFAKCLPQISDSIKQAAFIALDTEFTGLEINAHQKQSLFDTMSERYGKLRSNAESFIICQVGISAFIRHENENRYDAHTYNFYVCPQSKGIMNAQFLWQASGMEFLLDHGFDFNKFVSEGLPYLDQKQEADLRQQLKYNCLFSGIKREVDGRTIQDCCSRVADWLSTLPEENEQLTLSISRRVTDYIVHKEIRLRFSEVWTFHKANNQVIVQKVSQKKRLHLESTMDSLDEKLIDDFQGFTKVFNLLVELKKPLVGHNLLVDLLLVFNQFYKALPKSCEQFKADILELFPSIYDTKHISAVLRKRFEEMGLLDSSSLPDLYAALNSQRGQLHVFDSPKICHAEGFSRYDTQKFHEAGYDAFVAGYVFLRLAHMNFVRTVGMEYQRPISFHRLLQNMEHFRNKCNLIRANLSFIDLEGSDPKQQRPKWLVIKSKDGSSLRFSEVTEICSQFGSVDVKMMNSYAVVSVTNFSSVRQILNCFRQFDDYEVMTFSRLHHSRWTRNFLWMCATMLLGAGLKFSTILINRFI